MLFSMQAYAYRPEDLDRLADSAVLNLELSGDIPVRVGDWIKMEKARGLAQDLLKSMPGYSELVKNMTGPKPSLGPKPAAKWPAGSRWITIHPHGHDEKGVPVLIQDNGDGTAHIIAGAGGKLNLLKLNKLSSPDEAREKNDQRRAERQDRKAAERAQRKAHLAKLKETGGAEAVRAYRDHEKAVRQAVKADKENDRAMKSEALDAAYDEAKRVLGFDDSGLDETEKEAARSQVISQARAEVSKIRRDILADQEFHSEVVAKLKDSGSDKDIDQVEAGARKAMATAKDDRSLGFQPKYADKAARADQADKDKATLEKIEAEEGAEARSAAEEKMKREREREEWERKQKPKAEPGSHVENLDDKVALLKTMAKLEAVTDAVREKEKVRNKRAQELAADAALDANLDTTALFGDGTNLGDWNFTPEQLIADLKEEEKTVELERQARINGDFLSAVKSDPGAGKWIANGVYTGLNDLSTDLLKGEVIPRDVVDVLGVGSAAKLMAFALSKLRPNDLPEITEAVEALHTETNEKIVAEAMEKGGEFLAKAESIKLEQADSAGGLQVQAALNESRLEYLDKGQKILGQALGTLEARAALAEELKTGGAGPLEFPVRGDDKAVADRLRAIGLGPEDYQIVFTGKQRVARLGEAAKLKIIGDYDPEEVRTGEEVQAIKDGAEDVDGWLPEGIVSRPFDTFSDAGAVPAAGALDEQSIGNDEATREALHRTLGEIPEGRLAYTDLADLSAQDQTDLRRYWLDRVYSGSGAESSHGSNFYIGGGKGTTKSKEWQKFVEKSGGRAGAVQKIKEHLASAGEEDMFGGKTPHPLATVDEGALDEFQATGDLDSLRKYANAVPGAKDLIEGAQTLKGNAQEGLWFNPESKDWEDNPKKAKAAYEAAAGELTGKLKAAHDEALREHYHTEMSGLKASDYLTTDDQERVEGSAWHEYVRMHGGNVDRAVESVQDLVRGKLNKSFADNYAKVGKVRLKTGEKEIRNKRDHVLGMLSREDRDNFKTKAQAALSEAGATVANRANGRFTSGSWRDKAYELLSNKDKGQMSMFDDEDLKQDDGTAIPTLGARVEKQLAGILPEASANQRRGERYSIFPGMSMSGKYIVQQRAVKMFEKAKKMNLTFGTGQGKSVTSIGAFTHLHAQGKASRALFAVPSVVQGQFGGEMAKYTKPGAYRWKADPDMDQAGRIAALKDPKLHMYVGTHQALRDDMIHLMAEHQGLSDDAMRDRFNSLAPGDRTDALHQALDHHGIKFDMSVTDESHYGTNRAGKEDSTLANVMDALSDRLPYAMKQSATPVKNDASEAWDMLHKVAPDRFPSRDEFIARYGLDTEHSAQALRRIIGRYNYAAPTVTGVKRNHSVEHVQMTGPQRGAYDQVHAMANRAATARRLGKVDLEAMKALSPSSFEGKPESEHEAIAKGLQRFASIIKEEALNRVVNCHPEGAKLSRLAEIVDSKVYGDSDVPKGSARGQKAPGVVFAHNLDAVGAIQKHLEGRGLRVGVIHGGVTGANKDKVKNGFNPAAGGRGQYDVMVLSDAGATGLNLQNAKYLVNYDLPDTAWVKEQREGRIDRHGQAHAEVDYHDLVTDTEFDQRALERIKRKAALGAVFQRDEGAGGRDDSGVLSFLRKIRHEGLMRGER